MPRNLRLFINDRSAKPPPPQQTESHTMKTKAILARSWAAIIHKPIPPATRASGRSHSVPPREPANLNTPRGRRGIPTAARTKAHIASEPTVRLTGREAGATTPEGSAGD